MHKYLKMMEIITFSYVLFIQKIMKGRFSMNTRQLTYFLEIVKQRNMNKAAEALYVSQPSISQYLSRLEQDLGTPLFHRQKGNMTLTPAGKLYKEYAENVIGLEINLKRSITALAEVRSIRVGINSIWCNILMATITPQFKAAYPGIAIEISEGNHKLLKRMVADDEVDMAVIATDTLDALKNDNELLRYEEIVFAVSNQNPYFEHNPEPLDKLDIVNLVRSFAHDDFILTKESSSFRGQVDQMFRQCSFTPNIVCETSNIDTVRSMISHNIGVGFIPSSCALPGYDITYFSLIPRLLRINGIIYGKNLAFTEAEKYLIHLIKDFPLLKKENGTFARQ